MEASEFKEHIMIQKNVDDHVDRLGNHTNVWINYYACHAKMYSKGLGRTNVQDQTVEEISTIFEVRSCEKLKRINAMSYRVLYKGDIYNIVNVEGEEYHKTFVRIRGERAYNGQKN